MRADCIPTPANPRRVLTILLLGLLLAAASLPLDPAIAQFCRRLQPGGDLRLGGDFRRTLELLQQFGDVATCTICAIVIWLLDPARRRHLLQALLALVGSVAVVQTIKILAGRPRPRVIFGNPKPGYDGVIQFTGPFRPYPLPRTGPGETTEYLLRHSWEVWGGISSDLWSFPSSHTSAAAGLAVVLARFYPPLRPLVWSLVVIVAIARVVFGAHFPSDVIAGGVLGYAMTALFLKIRPEPRT